MHFHKDVTLFHKTKLTGKQNDQFLMFYAVSITLVMLVA